MKQLRVMMVLIAATVTALSAVTTAQSGAAKQATGQKPGMGSSKPPAAAPPTVASPDYIIGANDVLTIIVVGEPSYSGEFAVRPDGKITMLQIDELVAAGLKPEDLKKKIKGELTRFFNEPVPEVFIGVKSINSRNVFVDGAVNKRGPVPLTNQAMTIVQVISLAGGFQEFADKKHILVISGTQKNAKGESVTWVVNYEDILKQRNLTKNNIILQPGDTILVPGGGQP